LILLVIFARFTILKLQKYIKYQKSNINQINRRFMQVQTIRPKHQSVIYLIIMLFSISAFIFTGCARHSGLSSGEVKTIQASGKVIPLEKKGPVQVYSSGEGSSVVEMENVTIPALKEPPPPKDYIVGPNDSIFVTVNNAPEYSTSGTAAAANQPRGRQRLCPGTQSGTGQGGRDDAPPGQRPHPESPKKIHERTLCDRRSC
jgi:hypothetical protein